MEQKEKGFWATVENKILPKRSFRRGIAYVLFTMGIAYLPAHAIALDAVNAGMNKVSGDLKPPVETASQQLVQQGETLSNGVSDLNNGMSDANSTLSEIKDTILSTTSTTTTTLPPVVPRIYRK